MYLEFKSFGSQQMIFDFICDTFSQLKSFGFKTCSSISLRNLVQLNNLEEPKLNVFLENINICSMDSNQRFNRLISLKLMDSIMTPNSFETFESHYQEVS
jgi:hypothetical protein